ncbi:hypothetical protein B2J93_1685 [Marssonina coronariae]|uniref:Uncharacterized protein n=1 Tax=Diplocarpon coronariae TaxID=2795749 RepID=A0A218ZEP1_9HELO|nr:hypothetical protein B2J93_1685 [Marssonina coronariae]
MLLTPKQPAHHGYKSFHDYTPPTPPSSSRFSPTVASTGPLFPPTTATPKALPLPTSRPSTRPMSTPHRGLPPPGAMTLPPPQPQQQQQAPPPPAGQPTVSQAICQLPAPPQQWQGAEDSMKNWLHAKEEEDRRKQEEEKTRQESLRLEQRKVEQEMLRTSLSGGIPPYMIPMVFAGIGGGSLPVASLEWVQHYMAETHHLQQQQVQTQQLLPAQAQTSPEQLQRRDSRVVPGQHPTQQHTAPMTLPSTPIGRTSSQQGTGFLPSYQMSPASRARQSIQGQGVVARPSQLSHLPRLNTGETHNQPPPPGLVMKMPTGQPSHPLHQTQSVQTQEQQSSPSIYFHHWQPPTTQADHTSSPKKRKATGPQQSAPAPTSQPQYTSPPFSQTASSVSNTPSGRRRGHSRQQSDLSTRGLDSFGRPLSRHRHEGGFTSRGVASPPHQQQSSVSTAEPCRQSGPHSVSSMLEQGDSRLQPSHAQHPTQHLHRDPPYSAGSEIRRDRERDRGREHEGQCASPSEASSISRQSSLIKRDEGRD